MATGLAVALVSVTICLAVLVPAAVGAKLRLLGEMVTAGAIATPPIAQVYETVGCEATGAIAGDAEVMGPIPNIAVSPETTVRL